MYNWSGVRVQPDFVRLFLHALRQNINFAGVRYKVNSFAALPERELGAYHYHCIIRM
jgi:hypothetical protein